MPILIYDKNLKIISVIHAGWKGAYIGIIRKVIKFLIKNGSNAKDLIAVIGPSISQKNYEIQKDFKDKFDTSLLARVIILVDLFNSVNFKIFGSSCNHSTDPFVPYTLIFNPFSPPVAADDTQIDALALFFIRNIKKALSSTDNSGDKELTSALTSLTLNL